MSTLAERLTALLDERAVDIQLQNDYFTGLRPRLVLPDRTLPSYAAIVAQAKSPWGELIVSAAAERMRVSGFRVLTSDESDEDVEADSQAWDIWQHSQCDTWSGIAFQTMLTNGVAFLLVEPGTDMPLLSFESPEVMATLSAPGGRRTVAAIKRWQEDDTDVVIIWTEQGAEMMFRDRTRGVGSWEPTAEQPVVNNTGRVPVFPLKNRPSLLGGYDSDLTSLYSTIDRTTQTLADRLTTQFFASTKIRYLTGVSPEFDEDGNPTQSTLKMATDKLLLIESPDAKAGVFDASDLRQFIETARSDISSMAAIARLPSFLLSGDLVNVSAEAMRSLSEGLVSRVQQRQVWASAALSEGMKLALSLAGDERVSDPATRVEVVWEDVVEPNTGAAALAAQQLVAAGILSPSGAQDVVLGYSPTERQKLAQYRRMDALTQQGVAAVEALFAAPAAPAEAPAEEAPVAPAV